MTVESFKCDSVTGVRKGISLMIQSTAIVLGREPHQEITYLPRNIFNTIVFRVTRKEHWLAMRYTLDNHLHAHKLTLLFFLSEVNRKTRRYR